MVVKSIGVVSVGKILGVMYAIFGLIAGLFVSLFAMIGGMASQEGMMGMISGVGAIILLPIIYGLIGFIGGIITALIYNVLAGIVGGIELEVE